ncbi:MAG TPA: glycosyltransferase family 39 protein [Gemmatimonadaceae bacterium]|nr:glycosyltransferase family 39 protein [Gemmatimonadaceae bacterium]
MDVAETEAKLAAGPITAFALTAIALHLLTNLFSAYGVHRDEFLYLAMGRHLDLFRMEFPPAIAILARISMLFGDSLAAIRIFPALAAGALVAMAGLIAAQMGGGRRAQLLAAGCVLMNPLFLRAGNLFQPVVFDQLTWTVGLYALVRLGRTANPRYWILYGIAVGLGLLTKFSALFFGTATLAALIVSRERRWLATPWPWLAMLLVCVIGSPSWIGQIRLGFPVLQQMSDLRESQLERVTAAEFLIGQALLGPGFLIACVGVYWLLRDPRAQGLRVVGWTCVFAFLILLGLKGKPYYLGPIYPALFAAGALTLERPRAGSTLSALRIAAAAVLVSAYGLVLLPIGIPILPPERMARYTEAIGASEANRTNTGELDRLPQDYADMLGWPEQVAAVSEVYHSLPPAERQRAVVIAANYGEAGAIDFYGPALGLPRAVSTAGTYWFFGPGQKPGEVAVTVGIPPEELRKFFGDVRLVRSFTHPWSVAEERNTPIAVASHPYRTLQEVWPSQGGNN